MDGAALDQVQRVLNGQPMYTAPSLDYVPFIYPPLYYYCSALLAAVTGPNLFTLRLVSSVASVATFVLLYRFVFREARSHTASFVACGVLAASYPETDRVLDAARVDALFVCLLLAMLYLVRSSELRSRHGLAQTLASGALAGMAILTKQTALAPAIVVFGYLALQSRTRCLAFALAAAAVSIPPLALLVVQTEGWAGVYLVDLPRSHGFSEQWIAKFWTANILPRFTLPVLMSPLFIVSRLMRGDRRTAAFFTMSGLAMVGLAWLARVNRGASNSTLLPAFVVFAMLFGLSLHEGLRMLEGHALERRVFQGYLLGLCAVEFAVLAYNPRLTVPYRSDAWASQRLVDRIAGLPGRILAPGFGTFLRQAGRPAQAYRVPVEEITGAWGGVSPLGALWNDDLNRALQSREFDYVLTEQEVFFLGGPLENNGYVRVGPLFAPDDEFWLWTSGWTPAADVYVPRERAGELARAAGLPTTAAGRR
jgi:4-amino-4-deoxy-L-arabinose transferase-like glycosyltransferase